MDLKQRLEFCKKCQKRKFGDTGIVCSLTERKPDFVGECKDFEIDQKAAQRMISNAQYNQSYNETESSSSKSIWGIVLFVIIIIRILLRLMRD